MLVLVDTKQTPVTVPDFIYAVIKAWHDLYNTIPKRECVAIVYAQWALETGLSKYLWNNNIANLKAVDDHNPNTHIKYQMLKGTWEIQNGKKNIFQPPHPATWFRAFDTLDEGMKCHLDLLKNRRYKNSWSYVENGDPAGFSHSLKEHGYYTAPEADYTAAMKYHFNIFMKGPSFDLAMEKFKRELENVEFPDDFKRIDTVVADIKNEEDLKSAQAEAPVEQKSLCASLLGLFKK